MEPDACREWRETVGAAALDRLEPGESIALQAHLDGCSACRGELEDLRRVAAALSLADVDRVLDDPAPPDQLAARVLASVGAVRSERRRRRLARLLAAAAVVVLVLAIAALAIGRNTAPTSTEVALTGRAATGTAELRGVDAGTEVRLRASGLAEGEWYWLWVTDADDDRVAAGTFQGTGSELEVTTTAALPLADTHRVWVTGPDDEIVLDARL